MHDIFEKFQMLQTITSCITFRTLLADSACTIVGVSSVQRPVILSTKIWRFSIGIVLISADWTIDPISKKFHSKFSQPNEMDKNVKWSMLILCAIFLLHHNWMVMLYAVTMLTTICLAFFIIFQATVSGNPNICNLCLLSNWTEHLNPSLVKLLKNQRRKHLSQIMMEETPRSEISNALMLSGMDQNLGHA